MRRVLVPLDGTPLAASIVPDAHRLAGNDGELILVRDTRATVTSMPVGIDSGPTELAAVREYLLGMARELEHSGTRTETHALAIADPAHAIDVAAQIYRADVIACATHGRGPLGRLVRGGVAWRALANSTVPVLLRHFTEQSDLESMFADRRTVMVPLDGSARAESACALAARLADEWDARLLLVAVVPTLRPVISPYVAYEAPPLEYKAEVNSMTRYLADVAERFQGPVVTRTLAGGVVDELVACAQREKVTDIVLASHGRTGLSRVLLGSVADDLVHRLSLPIIVVPALVVAQEEGEEHVRQLEEMTVPGAGPAV